MNTPILMIVTPIVKNELIERISSMTVADFHQIQTTPGALYYGKITPNQFEIINVKYGPTSSFPPIKGEIIEGVNSSTIKIDMDVVGHYHIAKWMYLSTLIPIGIVVLLFCIFALDETTNQVNGFIFSGIYLITAFLIIALTKFSLISTKKRELKYFAEIVIDKIKPE